LRVAARQEAARGLTAALGLRVLALARGRLVPAGVVPPAQVVLVRGCRLW